MKFKSNAGYSLIEIGIALVIVGIFMTSSITLLSASNENYRMIEQRNIALSYAIKAIEAAQLSNSEINIDEIKNNAKIENNMEVSIDIQKLPPKNGKDYGDKIQIITANVTYHTKSNEAGSIKDLTLKTLKVNK